jgi:hypothetical protein
MPIIEEAVFARIRGRWKFQGFFDDKQVINDMRKQIHIDHGRGNFFTVVMPPEIPIYEGGFVSDLGETIPYITIACPKCGAPAGDYCMTVRGNLSPKPHSQRFRAVYARAVTTNLLV